MQEIYKNCFGSKKRNTALRQTKIGKHEYPKLIAMHIAVITKGFQLISYCVFPTRKFFCEFLYSDDVNLQKVHQSFFETPICSVFCHIFNCFNYFKGKKERRENSNNNNANAVNINAITVVSENYPSNALNSLYLRMLLMIS